MRWLDFTACYLASKYCSLGGAVSQLTAADTHAGGRGAATIVVFCPARFLAREALYLTLKKTDPYCKLKEQPHEQSYRLVFFCFSFRLLPSILSSQFFLFPSPSLDAAQISSKAAKQALLTHPQYGTRLNFHREKVPALSSLVDSHRIVRQTLLFVKQEGHSDNFRSKSRLPIQENLYRTTRPQYKQVALICSCWTTAAVSLRLPVWARTQATFTLAYR